MAGVGAPLMMAWQACGRDEVGGRRRGQQGRGLGGQLGGSAHGGGQQGDAPWAVGASSVFSEAFSVRACVR
jgi:hypothetical protein